MGLNNLSIWQVACEIRRLPTLSKRTTASQEAKKQGTMGKHAVQVGLHKLSNRIAHSQNGEKGGILNAEEGQKGTPSPLFLFSVMLSWRFILAGLEQGSRYKSRIFCMMNRLLNLLNFLICENNGKGKSFIGTMTQFHLPYGRDVHILQTATCPLVAVHITVLYVSNYRLTFESQVLVECS